MALFLWINSNICSHNRRGAWNSLTHANIQSSVNHLLDWLFIKLTSIEMNKTFPLASKPQHVRRWRLLPPPPGVSVVVLFKTGNRNGDNSWERQWHLTRITYDCTTPFLSQLSKHNNSGSNRYVVLYCIYNRYVKNYSY